MIAMGQLRVAGTLFLKKIGKKYQNKVIFQHKSMVIFKYLFYSLVMIATGGLATVLFTHWGYFEDFEKLFIVYCVLCNLTTLVGSICELFRFKHNKP